jgi:HEAT repeat protein/cyclophilin family peptidyl-prolyl cis-trans isomerase
MPSSPIRRTTFQRASATALAVALTLAGCKSTPEPAPKMPAAAPPPAPVAPAVSMDTRVGWLLRLEQARILRDPSRGPRPATIAPAPGAPRAYAVATEPDLVALSTDTDGGVRRRAILAIGRVGLPEGLPAVLAGLSETSEDIRAMSAFAAGLIGTPPAAAPLEKALTDPSALVRGRAAEALGLIGQPTSAAAIVAAFGTCRDTIANIDPDDETVGKAADVDACRLALLALVRLKSYDGVARLTLNERGQPISRWWPVAFAFQRLGDKQATEAMATLAASPGVYTPSFAMRALAAWHDPRVVPIAQGLAIRAAADLRLRVSAVRALGQSGGTAAVDTLLALVRDRATPQNLMLEAVQALGRAKDPRAFDTLLDLVNDSWPTMRAAALESAAADQPDRFLFVVPSLGADRDWSVRAALAGIFANLPADRVRGALTDLAGDADMRVRGPALTALAKVGSPDLTDKLFEAVAAPDFVLRATAARLIGEKKPEGGIAKLVAAFARADSDATYAARVAALEGLSKYGGPEALSTLHQALTDKEWPVRIRAAELLRTLGEPTAQPQRPAPIREAPEFFESARVLHPQYSPHMLIETRRGTVEVELDVVNAPLTSIRIIEMARAGFFNGMKIHRVVPDFVVQAGDPRGDGEGGPGYSMPDELSATPYVRGTVGMALDFKDTGGSQFFITLSPQPHLDDKYTAFGHVVSGLEFVDVLSQWDVIEKVQIWDGVTLK